MIDEPDVLKSLLSAFRTSHNNWVHPGEVRMLVGLRGWRFRE